MPAPNLLFARANGQTSVRVVFDQAMRQISTSDPTDPENPANWTSGGGLPAVTEVQRVPFGNNAEFELTLASAAPVAAGYSVSVSLTVESEAGEAMDPGGVTETFDVIEPDLTIASYSWTSEVVLQVTFSTDILDMFSEFPTDLLLVTPEPGARLMRALSVIRTASNTVDITFENAGTQGGRYELAFTRGAYRTANNSILQADSSLLNVWGQGERPYLVDPLTSITESSVTLQSNEVLGPNTIEPEGFPTVLSAYGVPAPYTLGSSFSQTNPDELTFSDAELGPVGSPLTVEVRKNSPSLAVGTDWEAQALSVNGDGSQVVNAGVSTMLSKLAGDPYELVFEPSPSPTSHLSRQIDVTLSVTDPIQPDNHPLLAFTFLNNQISVVLERVNGVIGRMGIYNVTVPVYQGPEFDFTAGAFALRIVDNVEGGFLAVSVDGEVVVGASYADLELGEAGIPDFATAIVLGHPDYPGTEFAALFTSAFQWNAYAVRGFIGSETRDLLDFAQSQATGVVVADAPSADDDLRFSATAIYLGGELGGADPTGPDTIRVVIALTAQGKNFDVGSAQLVAANGNVMDEVLFTPQHIIAQSEDIIAEFGHPVQLGSSTKVKVSITIAGVIYETDLPILERRPQNMSQFILTRQPDTAQPRHRLVPNPSGFGPSSVLNFT